MRYVAAYMLAALGGNAAPSEADIKDILESVGVGYDAEAASIVINKLKGKDINELIAAGAAKMSSMPAGGAPSAGGGGGGAAAGAADAVEEKEEAKKESSDEESDDDMGFGLFD